MASPNHIDARGLKCPLPVLKIEKHIESLKAGESFTLIADDPIARIDIPLFCQNNGHTCAISGEALSLTFKITKAVT